MSEQVGLVAVLDLKDFNKNYTSYLNSLRTMNLETGRVAGNLDNSFLGFGNSLLKIGAILSGAVLAGITAVGVAMSKFVLGGIRQAADMESQLSAIAAVLNISNEEASVFKDTIIQLGLDPTLIVTAQQAADVIEMLAKNGIFSGMAIDEMGRAAMEAGRAVIMLANATGADFSQAANIASTAMSLFNIDAGNVIDVVSGITSVVTNSKFTINDYELALRNGGAAAANFGVELDDFNTYLAITADELGTGMKSGTGFANFLYRLTPNTNKAEQAMRDLGLITADGKNIFFDSSGEMKNMTEISGLLWQSLMEGKVVTQEISNLTADEQILLRDLRAEYKSAEETIAAYSTGLESIITPEEERNKIIEEQMALMSLLSPEIAELESVSSDYVTTLSSLNQEQRLMAIETIFGRDALNSVLGIIDAGEPIVSDAAVLVDALGVSWSEAALMIENGITQWELMQRVQAKTDAIENATTRMDNLRGRMEILDGVVETLSLRIGDAFIPVITRVIQSILDWVQENEGIIESIGLVADRIGEFIESVIFGGDIIDEFKDLLIDIGLEDLATKFENATTSIENFVNPIIQFVQDHSDEIKGALEGISFILANFANIALLAKIGGLLLGLLNPVTYLIVAAGLLGAAWESNFGGIQEKVQLAIDKVREFLDEIGLLSAWDAGGIKGVFEELPTIIDNLKTKLNEIDWSQIQTNIAETFSNLGSTIAEKLNEADWSVVAETIINLLGTAFATAGAIGQTVALAIFNLISTGVSETNWSEISTEIGDGIGRGFKNIGLTDFISDMFGGEVDVYSVTETLYNALIQGAQNLGSLLAEGINFIGDWLDETDWSTLGETLVNYFAGMFIINAAILQALFEFLWALITGIDWLGLVEALGTAIEELFVGAFERLDKIFTDMAIVIEEGITSWFTDQSELVSTSVTDNIITPFLDTLATLGEEVWEPLNEWWNTFNTWVQGVTWEDIGYWITNAILTYLFSSTIQFTETLNEWWNTFWTWVTETDWESIAKETSDRIDKKLKEFSETVKTTLNEWWESMKLWFTETDWEALGKELLDRIEKKLETMWEQWAKPFNDFWKQVSDWFGETDWDALSDNIVDGLVAGIENGIGDMVAAVQGLASGAKRAWDDFWNSNSPSRLMMDSMENDIIGGAIKGITNGKDSLQAAMGQLGNVALSGITNDVSMNLPAELRPIQNAPSQQNINNRYEVNNSFAGSPQITDADMLQMTLSGFRG